MRLCITLALAALLVACGGSSAPPQEERPATWTSGDDEPLDAPDSSDDPEGS